MDHPEYSDPIVIPITITIPDPRPRPHGDRRDLEPSHHPSFTDPGWFRRQGVTGRPRADAVPLFLELPRYRPVPLPTPEELPSIADFKEMLARARRRAQEMEREAGRGDYGDALQHLLLGKPYTADVDEIPGPTFRAEETQQTPAQEPGGEPDIDSIDAETQKDLTNRRNDTLNESHLQAAETIS